MKLKSLIPALLCATGFAIAKSPVETYGMLSIKNNKLVDSAGNQVVLRGMSLFWHYDKGGKEFWTPSVVKYAQVNWHNTVIRAPIGVENRTTSSGTIKGAVEDPSNAEIYAKTIIEAAIDAGAYVIVDWHAHTEQTSAATAFFGKLAKEYGNTPNIIWEIFNEPTGSISESYINSVVTAIRQYSKNIVLIGSKDWSKYPEDTYGQVDSKFQNLAYTLHFYSDQSHYDQLKGKIAAAESKGHAVFVSEWGMSSYSGDGGFVPATSAPISSWLSLMNSSKISHCNWSLGNPRANSGAGSTPETSAALALDASVTPYTTEGGWPDASLTPSGKSIKAYLVANNPAWTLSDTTTRVLKPLTITSTKTTGFELGKDTVDFGGTFSKSAAWELAVVGDKSGAKKTYTGQGVNLVVRHPVSSRNLLTTAMFSSGETVTATLKPGGSKVTYAISTSSVGPRLTRVHDARLSWENSRIYLPDGLISASAPVRVMIRNAQGQVVWQKSATMGAYRTIEMNEAAPRLSGVNFLEVHSADAILRSCMAPTF